MCSYLVQHFECGASTNSTTLPLLSQRLTSEKIIAKIGFFGTIFRSMDVPHYSLPTHSCNALSKALQYLSVVSMLECPAIA